MRDLFDVEERLLQKYKSYLESIPEDGYCAREALDEIVQGYARALRQLRLLTRLSDKTAETLNFDKKELMQKMHHDALTGIYNRRFMDEKLVEILKKAEKSEAQVCFMMADVDFFKKYNDIYGHPMGDICLKAVADALAECVAAYVVECGKESEAFVARYGGEEFAVVLPDTSEERARQLGEALLRTVSGKRIPHSHNDAIGHVTISIGAVTGPVLQGARRKGDFIQAADHALYQSKQNGRNQLTNLTLEEFLK